MGGLKALFFGFWLGEPSTLVDLLPGLGQRHMRQLLELGLSALHSYGGAAGSLARMDRFSCGQPPCESKKS